VADSDEQVAARISESVARLYLDTFGKGPLHAQTFVNGDIVTTLLRDVFTVAENLLIDGGKVDSVLITRMEWQRATDERFRAAVARDIGRPVLAAVSGFDPAHGLASEIFVLEPNQAGGP